MTERKPSGEETSDLLPGESEVQMSTQAMKAFAHPLRMAMFSYLTDHGSATATTLAEHLNESTGQTSYHLRQLEKHGLVEEDTEKGTGRERWWKSTGFSIRSAIAIKDPANRPALSAMMKHQLEERMSTLATWMRNIDQQPAEWIEGSLDNTSTATMNPEESKAMMTELMEVIGRYTQGAEERIKNSGESPEDRRVRLYLSILPLPDLDTES